MSTNPALTTEPTSVYQLVQGTRFSYDYIGGGTGTRTFLDTDKTIPGSSKVDLPKIGDSWDENYEFITVKSIDIGIFNGDADCGTLYTVNYDGAPLAGTAEVITISREDLPKSIDIASEYTSFDPQTTSPSDYHFWVGLSKVTADTKKVKQRVARQNPIVTYKTTRIVKDFESYMNDVYACVGRLDSGNNINSIKGSVLFKGAALYPFVSKSGATRWKCELTFLIKPYTYPLQTQSSDGVVSTGGWNWSLNSQTGCFDVIKNNSSGTYSFEYVDFKVLFENDKPGEDGSLNNKTPILIVS